MTTLRWYLLLLGDKIPQVTVNIKISRFFFLELKIPLKTVVEGKKERKDLFSSAFLIAKGPNYVIFCFSSLWFTERVLLLNSIFQSFYFQDSGMFYVKMNLKILIIGLVHLEFVVVNGSRSATHTAVWNAQHLSEQMMPRLFWLVMYLNATLKLTLEISS